jgi:hypothetical protein
MRLRTFFALGLVAGLCTGLACQSAWKYGKDALDRYRSGFLYGNTKAQNTRAFKAVADNICTTMNSIHNKDPWSWSWFVEGSRIRTNGDRLLVAEDWSDGHRQYLIWHTYRLVDEGCDSLKYLGRRP